MGSKKKEWKKRHRGGDKIVTRLYTVNPKNRELFHLRLLLLHVRGAKGFVEVRTYNNIIYDTFVEAAQARGIASNDNEWRETLLEATETQSPKQLRDLFGYICGINVPSNALELWNEFHLSLCEDYLLQYNEEQAQNRALTDIEEILLTHNTSCIELNLPVPDRRVYVNVEYDAVEQGTLFSMMYNSANDEQRAVIDMVVNSATGESQTKLFCLAAHAGCGKTYVQKTILCKLRSLGLSCLPCAYSGIAASLLDGGRTLHNQFKLPINLHETSTSGITANSAKAQVIRQASLLIIDEISMCPLLALKTIDRFLRDIADLSNRNNPFGGKTVLMCGDFRQTIPVVPHAGRARTIESCVKSHPDWGKVYPLALTKNMRALETESDFAEFLLQIGNGTYPTHLDLGVDVIELPQQLISTSDIVEEIYGDISNLVLTNDVIDHCILSPKNEDCLNINEKIMNLLPGDFTTYHSYDRVVTDNDVEQNNYPTEFLNSLNLSGLPPHQLLLKVNAIVMLIRNLNTSKALINGTRMRVKNLLRNTIDCEVLTGASAGTRILIPRIHMCPSEAILPFPLERTQFPIIPAFAITINKAQGQSIGKVGVYLPQPVFSHGQFYVAASRARSFAGLKFFVDNTAEQGRLKNDHRVFTKNIVYNELL